MQLPDLHHLDELIRWGGYTILFCIVFAETGLLIGFFLPGDSLLVTAGLVTALDNQMNFFLLNALLMFAAIAGDSVGYSIGYHLGPKVFNKPNSLLFNREHVDRAHRFYEKYGAKTIVLARFVPIVRTFAPTVAGVAKMDYKKFLTYNILGGIGWVLSMTSVGYFLGKMIPDVDKKIHWIALIVIVLSIIPIIKEVYDARKEKKNNAPK